tara:strand:- start:279 stop:641 length:363 start_codon:yes stop_codon:yes gene_type:complete
MEQMGAFLPLILIFAIFYILLIRPQQRKIKLHREMLNNLKRGDKIITSGGIIGKISKVSDNKELIVEISDDVEIKIAPGMVTDLYTVIESKNKKIIDSKDDKNKNENKSLLSGFFNKKKN